MIIGLLFFKSKMNNIIINLSGIYLSDKLYPQCSLIQ